MKVEGRCARCDCDTLVIDESGDVKCASAWCETFTRPRMMLLPDIEVVPLVASRVEVVCLAVVLVLAFGTFDCCAARIWTGDSRWGYTAVLLSVAGVVMAGVARYARRWRA